MINFVCKTCGVQFDASKNEPESCPVCEDERQYVNWDGQQWTTITTLQSDYKNIFNLLESNLVSIHTEPKFAIGQRALLVQTSEGNILWDCISLIDESTINEIIRLGGLSCIVISHPHFYGSMIEWSRAFDNIPIYIHASDRRWVMRHDPHIVFWEGKEHVINSELTIINCGGHFPGSSVMHWKQKTGNKNVLFTGDTIKVAMDKRFVSFMYSYPNDIPLSANSINSILTSLDNYYFEKIYGGWPGHVVMENAREAVNLSANRYLRAIGF